MVTDVTVARGKGRFRLSKRQALSWTMYSIG